jgi:RNA recognition motif-containing protein
VASDESTIRLAEETTMATGTRLYVGNLPFQVTEAALREAFEQDGRKVVEVHLVTDRYTGQPRGFGFVEMSSVEDAQAAITAMDGQEMGGRTLKVNLAQERPDRGGGGGGGGNRRGGFGGGGGGGFGGGGGRGGPGGDRRRGGGRF